MQTRISLFVVFASCVLGSNLSPFAQVWYEMGEQLDVYGGPSTRIWRAGTGPPVLCLHGALSSAYLYRKVLPKLADQGFEGIAVDLPGMGFADRPDPDSFDYSWRGLAAYLERVLDAAGIGDFHLVVHDIAGPIGFELIRLVKQNDPYRVLSLTMTNTVVKVFNVPDLVPIIMLPFTLPVIGNLYNWILATPAIVAGMRIFGCSWEPPAAELKVYGEILRLNDGGNAFRNGIMVSWDTTEEFQANIYETLGRYTGNRNFPATVVWGKGDPNLLYNEEGEECLEALESSEELFLIEKGKHYVQEDGYVEIAARIRQMVDAREDI